MEAFEEHRETLFRWALEVHGIEKSQRTVGLHASRGIIELLSAYLHRKKKVSDGFQLNHRWFKSENVLERLPDFENKSKVIGKMIELENLSESLAYGSQKPKETIELALKMFRDLEKEIKRLG